MIERVYSKKGEDPFESVNWKYVDVELRDYINPDKIIFKMDNVFAPENWSYHAIEIASSKWFRRTKETSVRQMVQRVVTDIVTKATNMGLFDSEEANIFFDELVIAILRQECILNTPAMINFGVYDFYDVDHRIRNWKYNFKTGEIFESDNIGDGSVASACYLTYVEDELENQKNGLLDHLLTESRVFRTGGGDGFSVKNIRGQGEPIQKGAGVAEGLQGYLPLRDAIAGYIKSGGISRRSATMVVAPIDHPDIEFFIDWKTKEEEKAHVLIRDGYSSDFNGESYKTISGQNSNNSVMIFDEFMEKLVSSSSDKKWTLKNVTDPTVGKEIKVTDLWSSICYNAWKTGDPGVMFFENINKTWPARKTQGEIYQTNPCAEVTLPVGEDFASTCRLMTLNAAKFFNGKENRIKEFYHVTNLIGITLTATLYNESFPSESHARGTWQNRSIGANLGNVGTVCLLHGFPYDSDEGRSLVGAITSLFTTYLWYLSSDFLSEKIGPYPVYDREDHCRVLSRFKDLKLNSINNKLADQIIEESNTNIDLLMDRIKSEEVEFANSTVTCYVPGGTTGIVLDMGTLGIEPEFAWVKFKKMAHGGSMKIVNPSIRDALLNLGYSLNVIDNIENYILENNTVEGCEELRKSDYKIFETANPGGGENFISPEGHLKMLQMATPRVSMNISKTVNVPESFTVEEISELYIQAWKMGLKSVALYRDNCKKSQPLNVYRKDNSDGKEVKIKRGKPPVDTVSRKLEYRIGGTGVRFFVVTYPDSRDVAEIFIETSKLGAEINGFSDALGRVLSVSLQHGVPVDVLAKTLSGLSFDPQGFLGSGAPLGLKVAKSIPDLISKVLIQLGKDRYSVTEESKLIADQGKDRNVPTSLTEARQMGYSGNSCPSCGSYLIRGGCSPCENCGEAQGKCAG